MVIKKQNKQFFVASLVLVFVVALTTTVLLAAPKNAQSSDTWTEYATNSEGLTYGKVTDAPPWGEMPDLVAVEATNGMKGYAYWEELNGIQPENPEEAMRIMEDREAQNSRLFAEFILESIGIESDIDSANAVFAFEAASKYCLPVSQGVEWVADQSLRVDLTQAIGLDESVLPDDEELRFLILDIMLRVQEESTVEIPVYLEDGKTQIGVFK